MWERCSNCCPVRLPEWNRFYHDVVVRQIAYGAAPDRGRTLLELAEVLDPLVLPEAVDEIGMSGDLTAAPPLIAMARPGEAASRSPFVQLKAIESLGTSARTSRRSRRCAKFSKPRKLSAGCITANCESRRRRLCRRPIRVTARRCSRTAVWSRQNWPSPRSIWLRPVRGCGSAAMSAWCCRKPCRAPLAVRGASRRIQIRELSLGGGMGTKEDNLRIGSEADLEISLGMRTKIRAHVLLRRARVNEVGFEIVSTDLESRYRLRRLLVDALNHVSPRQGPGVERRAEGRSEDSRFDSRRRPASRILPTKKKPLPIAEALSTVCETLKL